MTASRAARSMAAMRPHASVDGAPTIMQCGTSMARFENGVTNGPLTSFVNIAAGHLGLCTGTGSTAPQTARHLPGPTRTGVQSMRCASGAVARLTLISAARAVSARGSAAGYAIAVNEVFINTT